MLTHSHSLESQDKQSATRSRNAHAGNTTFQFVDKRPATLVQRQQQALMESSPQAKQAAQLKAIANNNVRTVQLLAFQEMANSSANAQQAVQRVEMEEEDTLQGKFAAVQRVEMEEEDTLQGKFASSSSTETIQRQENKTGLPDNLKSGIENLSGYAMDDVKVHYNSPKPAQLQAHAYAQGTDIHLASGQEKHLPHEAWHVVQQKQGRVKPTMQLKGKVNINDDTGLEREADVMGAKAMQGN